MVSSPVLNPSVRTAQHRGVVAAAVTAGVRHVVYTSGMGARHDPGHSAAEDALTESGVHHAIMRNALYTDPFVDRALAQALTSGVIQSAGAGQGIASAAIGDLGEAAATASITMPTKQLWELRGPAWNFEEMATALTAALRRQISQEEVCDEDTGPFAVLFPLVRRGVFASEADDLDQLLGHAPTSVSDVVHSLVSHIDQDQYENKGAIAHKR